VRTVGLRVILCHVVFALSIPVPFATSWCVGNRREQIFRSDHDRKLFFKALGEACGMTGWRIHAWVLMSVDELPLFLRKWLHLSRIDA